MFFPYGISSLREAGGLCDAMQSTQTVRMAFERVGTGSGIDLHNAHCAPSMWKAYYRECDWWNAAFNDIPPKFAPYFNNGHPGPGYYPYKWSQYKEMLAETKKNVYEAENALQNCIDKANETVNAYVNSGHFGMREMRYVDQLGQINKEGLHLRDQICNLAERAYAMTRYADPSSTNCYYPNWRERQLDWMMSHIDKADQLYNILTPITHSFYSPTFMQRLGDAMINLNLNFLDPADDPMLAMAKFGVCLTYAFVPIFVVHKLGPAGSADLVPPVIYNYF